jgi:hypothetical protein
MVVVHDMVMMMHDVAPMMMPHRMSRHGARRHRQGKGRGERQGDVFQGLIS